MNNIMNRIYLCVFFVCLVSSQILAQQITYTNGNNSPAKATISSTGVIVEQGGMVKFFVPTQPGNPTICKSVDGWYLVFSNDFQFMTINGGTAGVYSFMAQNDGSEGFNAQMGQSSLKSGRTSSEIQQDIDWWQNYLSDCVRQQQNARSNECNVAASGYNSMISEAKMKLNDLRMELARSK